MRKTKRKIKNIRRRRKKQTFLSKFYFSLIGGFLFLGILGYGFFYFSSQFTIGDVKSASLSDSSEEKLVEIIKQKLTWSFSLFGREYSFNNFLISQNKKLSLILSEFPEIESIDIKRDYLQKNILFEVKEKQPIAIWQEKYNGSNCYFVDKNGTFIKNCDCFSANGLVLIKEENNICNQDLEFKKNILAQTKNLIKKIVELKLSFDNLSLFAKDKISFNLSNGCQIFFDPSGDLDWQVEKLVTVLGKSQYFDNLDNLKYIELRYGNTAALCQKGQKCASE